MRLVNSNLWSLSSGRFKLEMRLRINAFEHARPAVTAMSHKMHEISIV